MFGIGKNKGKHKELEEILDRIKMYMENNYKDSAKDAFAQLKDKFNMLKNSGKLKAAQEENYTEVIKELEKQFETYTHKVNTIEKI
ncbi:hypothetical protein [uncultured Eubacterium sp.]|uniref:hypothetical protein n=1 Tax=uncultured Eubacterium sp. TaxID=165185 RepID=UPI000E8A1C8E|nr:hypothetical protein [uncultured Eubacterium sp.]HAH18664.1 hypothetical protein [Eubacterium sp.]HAV90558.1 hypothetical protein [Eubacterium sp.]